MRTPIPWGTQSCMRAFCTRAFIHMYVCIYIHIYTYVWLSCCILKTFGLYIPVVMMLQDGVSSISQDGEATWGRHGFTGFFLNAPKQRYQFFSRHKACSHPTFFCPGQVWWRSSMVNLLWCWRRSNWGYQWYHESLTMHQSWGYHGNMRDLHTTSRSTVRSEKCLGAEG